MRDVMERIWNKTATIPESGCWLFLGCLSADGYGRIRTKNGSELVHRVAYRQMVGPIPPGKELDHYKCHIRFCWNPDHLRAVSHLENVLSGPNHNVNKTHCKRGHKFTEENTIKERPNSRRCRECTNEKFRSRTRDRRLVLLFLATVFLAGCGIGSASISPPPQPTPAYLQSVNLQLAALAHSDGSPLSGVETWQLGSYAVNAACNAYLNSAATQQTNLSLGGMGAGMVGGGLSLINPLAGVASSLAQTLLTAYSASGPVPTTADAILITRSMDALQAGVDMSLPATRETAIHLVDKLWFKCSAGGAAITELEAKTSAQMGVMVGGRMLMPQSRLPTVIVNPSALPPVTMDTLTVIPDTLPDVLRHRAHPRLKRRQEPRESQSPTPPSATASARDRLDNDPAWPARRELLRATMGYVRALDGPRP